MTFLSIIFLFSKQLKAEELFSTVSHATKPFRSLAALSFVSQSISPRFDHHLMSYWPTFAIIIKLGFFSIPSHIIFPWSPFWNCRLKSRSIIQTRILEIATHTNHQLSLIHLLEREKPAVFWRALENDVWGSETINLRQLCQIGRLQLLLLLFLNEFNLLSLLTNENLRPHL